MSHQPSFIMSTKKRSLSPTHDVQGMVLVGESSAKASKNDVKRTRARVSVSSESDSHSKSRAINRRHVSPASDRDLHGSIMVEGVKSISSQGEVKGEGHNYVNVGDSDADDDDENGNEADGDDGDDDDDEGVKGTFGDKIRALSHAPSIVVNSNNSNANPLLSSRQDIIDSARASIEQSDTTCTDLYMGDIVFGVDNSPCTYNASSSSANCDVTEIMKSFGSIPSDTEIADFDFDLIEPTDEDISNNVQGSLTPLPHKEVSCVEIVRPADVCDDIYNDPRGPYQVQKEVAKIFRKWDAFSPVSPDVFLAKLLDSRGYDSTTIPAITSSMRKSPTPQQLNDYDVAIIRSIRSSNLDDLRVMVKSGKCMSACNRFSESIVHLASRSAEFHILDFIIRNGGDTSVVDDYGRTPLHDACWRPEPRFDVVTLLLDTNVDLIRVVDVRGSSPLNYVRKEHWLQWCAFIYHQKDKWWPAKNNAVVTNV